MTAVVKMVIPMTPYHSAVKPLKSPSKKSFSVPVVKRNYFTRPPSSNLLLIKMRRIAVLKYCRIHIFLKASVICIVSVWCPSNLEEYRKKALKDALIDDDAIEISRAS